MGGTDMAHSLREKAAISGIGETAYTRGTPKSGLARQAAAASGVAGATRRPAPLRGHVARNTPWPAGPPPPSRTHPPPPRPVHRSRERVGGPARTLTAPARPRNLSLTAPDNTPASA